MTRQGHSCGALLVSLVLAGCGSGGAGADAGPGAAGRGAATRAPEARRGGAAAAAGRSGNGGAAAAAKLVGRPDAGAAGRGGAGGAAGAAGGRRWPGGRPGAGVPAQVALPEPPALPAAAERGQAATAVTGAGGVAVPPGYRLVWSDEFNVDGAPNPANWRFEQGFQRNEEAQWYQPDNARVLGGVLIIEARRERKANPNYQAGSSDWKTSRQYAEYTSTSMHTSGLHSWQFGRFEMRARIETRAGLWPAWWTLGVSGEWPSNGEVDIMEFYQGKILANVACGTSTRWTAKWDSVTKQVSTFDADWSTGSTSGAWTGTTRRSTLRR